MKKKILKIIIAICAFVLVVGVSAVIVHQKKDLDKYENGFKIIGTYAHEFAGPALTDENQQEYLVFPNDEANPKKYYFYKPLGKEQEGVYQTTKDSNLYILKDLKGEEIGFVTVKKGYLFVTTHGKTDRFNKISDIETRISIDEEP